MEANKDEKIVQYAPYCTRGELIALLYNHAVRLKGGSEISPDFAEDIVHKQLGDARTLEGKTIPNPEGLINAIEGVSLNIFCYEGAVDASGYPHDDGRLLIEGFVSKRLSDHASIKARSANWEPIS